MEKSRPSVLFFFLFFFFSWEWGCMATVRSAMCVLSGAGPSGARPHLNKCFMERKRRCVFIWMRCQDNCNWSALLKNFVWVLQCMLVQSVCMCVCLCACVSVCECVGVLFVSLVFSQRRFTEYHLPPLATLPCGEIKGKSCIPEYQAAVFQPKKKNSWCRLFY